MKKILFIVIDGLGDKPIEALGFRTPLEAAETPNLDFLAREGICGLLTSTFQGAIPTSEEGHFSLFGYNPKVYRIRRGFFTVKGAGMKMKKGDVALRGNFGTVADNLNIIDRRAGRISDTQPLINSLRGIVIEGVKFLLKGAGQHRLGIILRGKNLSEGVSDGDPFYSNLGKRARKILPLAKSSQAVRTARVLNKFLEECHRILKEHPLNKKRKEAGLPPANYILVRGASTIKTLPSFEKRYGLKSCCIAGKLLYRQIGKVLGMKVIKVKGDNGLITTNLKGKIQAAEKALEKPVRYQNKVSGTGYDFCFLHIKAADTLAEDGNFRGKKEFIEKIDKNLTPLLKLKKTLIVVTADHSTCSVLRRHCKTPFPVLVFGGDRDNVKKFSERECKKGKLGKSKSIDLLKKLIKMKVIK